MEELAFLDATAQADLVRRKEVTPIELVDAAIERTERLNPTLNAVVTKLYDQARKAASGPLPDGPFTGVPFLLKDLGPQYAGVPLSQGSAFSRDFVPTEDSELTIRYKRAGLVIMGKSNTPEFGLVPTTEPRLFGPARNPWDTARSPGGSSGGSAAAVAAGIVPAAHGNDGGGSIRIPASCCGLFGLKPTRARTPMGPALGDVMSGLAIDHALTRSVRDSAALLDAAAGPDPGDPYWAPPPQRPYLQEVGSDPGRLSIAITTQPLTGAPIHPDCVAAARDAAALCADLGHHVEEAAPALDGQLFTQAFIAVWASGTAWGIDALARVTGRTPEPDQFEPLTWTLYQMGRQVSASDYLLAVTAFQQVGRAMAHFLTGYDIWLTPTLGEPPLLLGAMDVPDNPMAGFMRAAQFVPFTPYCNASGQPAVSVPLYWNNDGLPIGVHFVARFGDEATLFRLAAQLEQARPWADRRPPVSAAAVSA